MKVISRIYVTQYNCKYIYIDDTYNYSDDYKLNNSLYGKNDQGKNDQCKNDQSKNDQGKNDQCKNYQLFYKKNNDQGIKKEDFIKAVYSRYLNYYINKFFQSICILNNYFFKLFSKILFSVHFES